jgi:hypothetical protein
MSHNSQWSLRFFRFVESKEKPSGGADSNDQQENKGSVEAEQAEGRNHGFRRVFTPS